MPVTNAFLDRFVAAGFSTLNRTDLPDLSAEVSKASSRLNSFLLCSFIRTPKPKFHTLFFTIVRRANSAAAEYQRGRDAIRRHSARVQNDCGPYFDALYSVELAISSTAQAYQFLRKVSEVQGNKQDLYKPGAGSEIERLDRLYNSATKHIQTSTLTDDQLHALRLTNSGIDCNEAEVTWEEFAGMVQDVGNVADILVNHMMK